MRQYIRLLCKKSIDMGQNLVIQSLPYPLRHYPRFLYVAICFYLKLVAFLWFLDINRYHQVLTTSMTQYYDIRTCALLCTLKVFQFLVGKFQGFAKISDGPVNQLIYAIKKQPFIPGVGLNKAISQAGRYPSSIFGESSYVLIRIK